MRPTLLGSLLDAAAHNVARGVARRRAVRVGHRLSRGAGEPLADEHHGARRAARAATCSPASWRGERRATADFFAAKGLLAAVLDALGVDWSVEADAVAVPAPGRARGGARRRRAARLHRRAASAGRRARGTSSASPSGRSTSARVAALAPEVERFAPFGEYPGRARGPRGRRRRRRSPPARSSARCAAPAAELLSASRCSTSTAASQVGEGRVSLALHLEFRAAGPHADRRGGRRRARARSRRRSRASLGASCVPRVRVVVVGASGYAGALAARLVWRHPQFELAAITAREDAGRRAQRPLPAAPRAARARAARPRPRRRAPTPRSSPTRTARAAPVVAALLERGRAGRRPLRRLPPARRRDLRALVCPAPAPGADRAGGLRADRALPRADRGGRARRLPRLLPDRGDPRARAARRGRADRRRRDRRQDRRLGRWASSPGTPTTSSRSTENVRPYGVGAHRHMPEIDQELAALGAPVPIAFTPHLLPIDQGELLSCYVTPTRPRRRRRSSSACYAARYGGEPFIELVASAPGVRDVRETNVCAINVHADERTGKAVRVRRDRQPLEGDRLAGDREPQPDVRLRRGARDLRERLLQLALGVAARAMVELESAALPAGFRAAGVAGGVKPGAPRPRACSSAMRAATVSAARFLRRSACWPRRWSCPARARRSASRCAPSSPTPATRTRRPASGHRRRRARPGGCRAALGLDAARRWRSPRRA